MASKYCIGIDEVGRGCLAGPIVVAALALPLKLKIKSLKLKSPLRDSKKLNALQREEWFKWIKRQSANSKGRIVFAKASVYPKVIDRINISKAANLAGTRALRKLCSMIGDRNVRSVLLDGGLYINNFNSIIDHLEPRTIIRGDEKYNSIKLASIAAKVSRDRIMKRWHKKFPHYELDKHKGYGTKVHIQALKKHGFCELHRCTSSETYETFRQTEKSCKSIIKQRAQGAL